VNIASSSVSGIDFQLNYTTKIPFSLLTDTGEQSFNLNFLGTWTEKSNFVPVQGLATLIECAGEFGGECGQPTPTFKWTARASFVDGPLTTSLRWRHLSSTQDDDIDNVFTDFNGIERISAYDLIDLTLSVEANDNLTLSFGVNNLFDTLPGTPTFNGIEVSNRPNSLLLGDNQEQANTYPSTFDVIGRDFFVSASLRF
jgi:iron complex outermembrane recepter protein